MAATVSLHEVVDELEALIDESAAYLNRETGEVYSVRDEDAGLIEDGVDPDASWSPWVTPALGLTCVT